MELAMNPSSSLVLFDIDGTLLRKTGPHHRQALERAVKLVSGREATTDGIPVAGMLDRDILRLMMEAAGIAPSRIRLLMPPVVEKAQALYVRLCPDLRGRVCPGVRPLLRRLSARGIPVGLVTGNLSRIAWTKMRRAELKEHIRFGAFAEEGRTRGELAALAARRARREGWITRGALVTLVGDHPNDILAAREANVRSVAVGTGVVPYEVLKTLAPDHAVPDLRSLTPSVFWGDRDVSRNPAQGS
jgi:phosphoglycolate phosphatase-like HAD superfamily hydrolase